MPKCSWNQITIADDRYIWLSPTGCESKSAIEVTAAGVRRLAGKLNAHLGPAFEPRLPDHRRPFARAEDVFRRLERDFDIGVGCTRQPGLQPAVGRILVKRCHPDLAARAFLDDQRLAECLLLVSPSSIGSCISPTAPVLDIVKGLEDVR